jgi:uncharacterized membrane protein YhaH (DUF805 family)
MTEDRPPLWADWLLTFWVLFVGVVYFGGYFAPEIGALTTNASAFYALMVLTSVLFLSLRRLRRPAGKKDDAPAKRKP